MTRKIIHIDMDAFYASLEIRDRPELRDKPVIVGGSPNSRGVVATCNYIAREFGVHSAMPCRKAHRLCPNAVFVRPNFAKYRAVSQTIRTVFNAHSNKVEHLSLDEAFLDVTDHPTIPSATHIAEKIRCDIFEQTQLTCSAGVGPNKLIAKIASEINKPNGIKVVPPRDVEEFMNPLLLKKIPGVGPVSWKKLQQLGLHRCQDVNHNPVKVFQAFGTRYGKWLLKRCQGIDDRDVGEHHERKSMSREATYSKDISGWQNISHEIRILTERLCQDAKQKELSARCITVKIRYNDFHTITRSTSLSLPTRDPELVTETALGLARNAINNNKIRLLGVSLKQFQSIPQGTPRWHQPRLIPGDSLE